MFKAENDKFAHFSFSQMRLSCFFMSVMLEYPSVLHCCSAEDTWIQHIADNTRHLITFSYILQTKQLTINNQWWR